MPLISELVTKITADNKDFLSKVDESLNSVGNFSKKAVYALTTMAAAIATVGVGAFVSLISTINETTESISDLVDQSTRLNTSVASLQKLEYAAKLSGVSVGSLNSALNKMSRTLYSAQEGNKKAQQTFKDLGLSIESLSKLSVDEQYTKIASAIQNISDKNLQGKAAFEIFGRAGREQLSLIKSDVQGAFAEFDKFGGSLTNQQASAVEEYGDSLDKLGAIFDAFKLQLTASVAPALLEFTQFIQDSILKFGGLGNVGKEVGKFIIDAILAGVKGFQSFLNIIDSAINKFRQLQLSLLEFRQQFDDLGFATGVDSDIDFNRLDQIARLRKQISQSNNGPGFTDSLVKGLEAVRSKLDGSSQAQSQSQKNSLDVYVDKQGVIQVVVDSPDFKGNVNDLVKSTIAQEARGVNR